MIPYISQKRQQIKTHLKFSSGSSQKYVFTAISSPLTLSWPRSRLLSEAEQNFDIAIFCCFGSHFWIERKFSAPCLLCLFIWILINLSEILLLIWNSSQFWTHFLGLFEDFCFMRTVLRLNKIFAWPNSIQSSVCVYRKYNCTFGRLIVLGMDDSSVPRTIQEPTWLPESSTNRPQFVHKAPPPMSRFHGSWNFYKESRFIPLFISITFVFRCSQSVLEDSQF